MTQVYAAWETDEVIGFELWRNLGLGIACVFVITIILLADLRICFFVLVSDLPDILDVLGLEKLEPEAGHHRHHSHKGRR